MFIARFSYDIQPADRQRALDLISKEVAAAHQRDMHARLLVPLTRGHGAPALQFELELQSLDQLDTFRQRGVKSPEDTGDWMHAFSEILTAPPIVEIFRVAAK